MKKYILTLDEGTTSARAIIFDQSGSIVSLSQHEFTQIYPQPGFVEHDPIEILSAQLSAVTESIVKAGISATDITAVGITNQRETTVVWDKYTGEPIYNAIVWQCRRTADICEDLKSRGLEDYVSRTCGLKIDAYFSGTKIKWILDNVEGARQKANEGRLCFGTVDTWLMWKMSGGKIFATDSTNASRTMLFDIHNMCWDERMLRELDIPRSMLPHVKCSGSNFGDIEVMGVPLSVCGVAGDQQAALFGQKCFNTGDVKNTYGTGCFLLMNTGNTAVESKNGLVTTVAATLDGEAPQYALEGSVFIGGAVIQWLRDELKFIENAAQSEELALSVNDSAGVYIVPAFAGLGAPYWDMYARGTICGLTRGANRNHIVRAALESIAYQSEALLSAMKRDANVEISSLKSDGGAAANRFLMQFQADISNTTVIRPLNAEATALGVFLLAAINCGILRDRKDALEINCDSLSFSPNISNVEREKLINGWHRAIKSTTAFCEE
ncbi:MAG: glycerol kinase GlpK [Acutalibacteraceae bacterium]|nr:glycerol kinase GlpK [Acutalibacteraceae bacterium]